MDKNALIFSAHSLQTYVDCPRRFELSYLEELVWPAVEREPVLESEQFLENGRIFHEMVHRDILGLPVSAPAQPDIARWWGNYRTHQPAALEGEKYPEKTLVGEIGGHVLVATYDLIVLTPDDEALIFDWKTWRHPEKVKDVRERLQSRVYPFLLVQAASTLAPGLRLAPENVEMQYWLTEEPDAPRVMEYSSEVYEQDRIYLEGLVEEILKTEAGDFPLTEDMQRQCKYCPYRSYCGRGDVAGRFEEEDVFEETDLAAELLGNLDDYEAVAF